MDPKAEVDRLKAEEWQKATDTAYVYVPNYVWWLVAAMSVLAIITILIMLVSVVCR